MEMFFHSLVRREDGEDGKVVIRWKSRRKEDAAKDRAKRKKGTGDHHRATFSRREVMQHTSKETAIWVIHDNGVYDITDFVDYHPGGERIMMAAGRSIDPFWSVFTIHQTPETRAILEDYRIGDLIPAHDDDPAAIAQSEASDRAAVEHLFANEPKRHPSLIIRSAQPCNAETPHDALSHFITPTDLHYVRNHLPVPAVVPDTFHLELEGPGIPDGFSISLHDLKTKFPKVDTTVTLQCAGNRRKSMADGSSKPVKGLPWEEGAISTAVWSGARLPDVLAAAGYHHPADTTTTTPSTPSSSPRINHIQFSGLDGYGA
ncbi:hypothetical protein HK104_001223, partial [Borealophlyctis nickersoniae]